MSLENEMQRDQELVLEIEELASGGDGLAHGPDGRVVFVPGALGGERVRARLQQVKKDFARAELLEVEQASPDRVEPECPLYGRCGGCQLQHLAYPAQVRAKAAWVRRALSRLGDLPAVEEVASPSPWGWRHRVRLALSPQGPGFYAAGSNRVVPVEHCPVAAREVNLLLSGLAEVMTGSGGEHVSWLELLAGEGRGFVTCGLDAKRPFSNRWRKELRSLCRRAGATATRLHYQGLEPWERGPEEGVDYYRQDDLTLSAYPGEFCQANFGANELLINLVLEAAAGAPLGDTLELYAGGGNFTLPLAQAGRTVLAVEGDPDSHQSAEHLAEREGLAGLVEQHQAEASEATASLAAQGEKFALALLDPPRTGAKEVMPFLVNLGPSRIVYISCHPAALARDAAVLLAAGYAMTRLWTVDLFPHTGHTEAVLVLDRA
ncbi:MAG: TRAM domain-containing protein [Desulfarculaceae bacterium]|nr:TRAM domain-containing protein [Desulfarculaceae bacterium]